MDAKWIAPKTIVCPIATSYYYYPRTEIVKEIWDELKKENSY